MIVKVIRAIFKRASAQLYHTLTQHPSDQISRARFKVVAIQIKENTLRIGKKTTKEVEGVGREVGRQGAREVGPVRIQGSREIGREIIK